jgi:hypothetical protein
MSHPRGQCVALMNLRRPLLQRLRRRLPHLLSKILLTLLYLAGAVHLALQQCRLTSLLCLVAAAATAVSRRHMGSPSPNRSLSPFRC